MNEMKTLTFSPFAGVEHKLKTVVVDGVMWTAISDVSKVLGVSSWANAHKGYTDDEKGKQTLLTPGGPQTVWCVNRAGLARHLPGEGDAASHSDCSNPVKCRVWSA